MSRRRSGDDADFQRQHITERDSTGEVLPTAYGNPLFGSFGTTYLYYGTVSWYEAGRGSWY
eukprot:2901295-Rhodomonas_salina.1